MKKINKFSSLLAVLIVLGFSAVSLDFVFAQGADATPPKVVSTYPRDGAGNISTRVQVRVTFSEAMDPSSVTTDSFILTDDMGNAVNGEVTYANRTAAFIAFTTLDENNGYVATVTDDMRDISGNQLPKRFSWTFQTSTKDQATD